MSVAQNARRGDDRHAGLDRHLARALALSPSLRIVSALGPMKVMPASVQASTKSGFSDSRP